MDVTPSVVVHDGLIRSKLLKEMRMVGKEVSVVRGLTNKNPGQRMAQLSKLAKCFAARGRSHLPHNEGDLVRIWKGLLYAMWMADKPEFEEKLAKQLAEMVGGFAGNTDCSLAYFSAFMLTMSEELYGIDLLSIHKFPMLVRLMLRSILCIIKRCQWSVQLINNFHISMLQSVLSQMPKSRRLAMLYMSVFIEELAMVANGEITAYKVNMFLSPFVTFIATQPDDQLVAHCRTEVLHRLLNQSDLGREANPYPGAGIEKLFPALPFSAECVLDALDISTRSSVNSKRQEVLRELIQNFETYNSGVFPMGVRIKSEPVTDGKTSEQSTPWFAVKIKNEKDENLNATKSVPKSVAPKPKIGGSKKKLQTKNAKVKLLQRKRKAIMLEKQKKKANAEDPGSDTQRPKPKRGRML